LDYGIAQHNFEIGEPMKPRKIYLALVAFLLTACGLNVSLNSNTEMVTGAAEEIAAFDLPAGFSPEFSASLDDYTLVSYTPGDGHSHLYLVQSQDATDADKLAQVVKDIIPGERDAQTRMTIIETRPVTVDGQGATLVVSEGSSGEGQLYRQALVAFEGRGGPALLVFSTPITDWDPETVDALISSLH